MECSRLEGCVVPSKTSRGRQIIIDSSVLKTESLNFWIYWSVFRSIQGVFFAVWVERQRICNIWLHFCIFFNRYNNAWSRREWLPVYDIIGFFCADDTESVYGSVSRCKVGMLSWSARKTSVWALTASQELAHTGDGRQWSKQWSGCLHTSRNINNMSRKKVHSQNCSIGIIKLIWIWKSKWYPNVFKSPITTQYTVFMGRGKAVKLLYGARSEYMS